MKITIRILLIISLFILVSSFCSIKLDDFFINTIYTVSGIMFSVGLGLIVTFNIGGIKNKKYIMQIRKSIDNVRNSFLKYFIISTLCFILDYYLRKKEFNITALSIGNLQIELNWSILFCLLMLYSIVYYVANFIEIQKLNNDIFDKTNEMIS